MKFKKISFEDENEAESTDEELFEDISEAEETDENEEKTPEFDVDEYERESETEFFNPFLDDDYDDLEDVASANDQSTDEEKSDSSYSDRAQESRPTKPTYKPRSFEAVPDRKPRRSNIDQQTEQSLPVEEHAREQLEREPKKDLGDGPTPAEKWQGSEPKQRRYRWVRDNGMLNGAELEFFKNAGITKTGFDRGQQSLDHLRPPTTVRETVVERERRLAKVSRTVGGRDAYRRNAKSRFNLKDAETLAFIAKFKYVKAQHLRQVFSESIYTTTKRLKKLRLQGLVIDKKLVGTDPLWFVTSAGMALSGLDLPKVTESRLTYSMFPHQFTVAHVAANLRGAHVNVLNDTEYPRANRESVDGTGTVLGENLISELEIQSSFGRMRLLDKSEVYVPKIRKTIEREFTRWERAGGTEFGPSPERLYGNEYMYALFPKTALKLAYHVPDLVVSRPRDEDGSPNSIALEIELGNKPYESYRRTLQAYKHDDRMYAKLYWICSSSSPANKLKKAAEEIGFDKKRLDVLPIITEDGVFRGSEQWVL